MDPQQTQKEDVKAEADAKPEQPQHNLEEEDTKATIETDEEPEPDLQKLEDNTSKDSQPKPKNGRRKTPSEEMMFYLLKILCKNLPIKPRLREKVVTEFCSQLLIKEIFKLKKEVQKSSTKDDIVPDCSEDLLISRIIRDSETLPALLTEYSKYNSKKNNFVSDSGNSNEDEEDKGLLLELQDYAKEEAIPLKEKKQAKNQQDLNDQDDDEEDDDQRDEDKGNYKDDLKRLLCSSLSKDDDEEDAQMTQEMKGYDKQANKLDLELEKFKKRKEEEEEEIKGPIMSISNDSLSYERFYPGRILGNTFQITNKSPKKAEVTLSFTTEGLDKKFALEKLMEFYEVSSKEEIEQPYLGLLDKPFVNSQELYNCWYIEDPKTKSLVKKASLILDPEDSYEFIIVLKSPVIKKPQFLLTNVKCTMKILSKSKKIPPAEESVVFAFGSLDVPRLICPKEIMDENNNYSSVKVVMKKSTPIQVFRFLLINKGDMPINIHFSSLENDDMLLFIMKTRNMSLEPGQRSILELKANHKFKSIPNDKWKTTNTHKLIIGKIQDCELKFSLIVDVIIIN
ncbi:unnamed protein product [Moneuplotes crassus]|uniref:Uncharacterized protein n=2 Tax=Euplotes crassus TaxID=5936 RepID=A0AAD1UAI8_EUPCR|nr:unnamed protein product [Moneuplotes crassus]